MAFVARTCHSCGLEIEIPVSAPGTVFTCPSCNAEIIAGAKSARPERPPPRRPVRGGRPPARPPARSHARSGGRRRPASGSPPTGLIVAGILILAVIAGVLFALKGSNRSPADLAGNGGGDTSGGTPAEATGPVRTTFDAVLAGTHPEGTRVRFPVAVYPGSLLQISGQGGDRYYTLAVPQSSDILRRVRDLARRADDLVQKDLNGLDAHALDDARLKGPCDRYDDFLEDLEFHLRIRDGDKAIGIQIAAFDDLSREVDWEPVVGFFDYKPEMTSDMRERFMEAWKLGRELDALSGAAGIPIARNTLEAMAKTMPPDLDAELPDIDQFRPDGTDEGEVDAFNEVVDLYNAELTRHRRYEIQQMKETCLFYAAMLKSLVRDGRRDLTAEVLGPMSAVAKSFDRDVAYSPGIFVKELAQPQVAFATQHYRTAEVLVSSYPPGATVKVDGAFKGTTPLVLTGLVPGKPIELSLELAGHTSSSRRLTPKLKPNAPHWLQLLLWPVE